MQSDSIRAKLRLCDNDNAFLSLIYSVFIYFLFIHNYIAYKGGTSLPPPPPPPRSTS